MTLTRPIRSCIALALCWSLLGCQPVTRVEECRAVARLVNPTLASIDADRRRAPGDAATYRSIAQRYTAVAGTLEVMKSSNRRLLETVLEYAKVLREGAHDATQLAEALESKNAARETVARAGTARTTKHEGTVAPRLESICRGR